MKKIKKMTLKKDGNIFKIFERTLVSSSLDEVLAIIEERILEGRKTLVVTPNPEFMVYAYRHPWFEEILIHSDMAIPDGIALLWAREVLKQKGFFNRLLAGFLTGGKIIFAGWGEKRVTGTDLMEKLCQLAAKKEWRIYLLGGKPGIATKTLKVLRQKYPGLKGWATTGPNLELRMDNGEWRSENTSDGGRPILRSADSSKVSKWVDQINRRQPDLLFVAFGMGKQEKFIADNWDKLKVKMAMGVGGAFDYLSGEVKRAPFWLRKMGFEWLYRLCQEPWRWKRQMNLLTFIRLVLKKD